MIFHSDFFQKHDFNLNHVQKYLTSAKQDLKIAQTNNIPEVRFQFAYNSLIKLGLSLIAKEGYRVRSNSGHHMHLINAISSILQDREIYTHGNRMRQLRNMNMYEGFSMISSKDSIEYLQFVEKVFKQANKKLGLTPFST
jgi:hypothetical protein